jgi:hypothetical protein
VVAVNGPDAPTSWARPIVRAAPRLDRISPWALLFLRPALALGLQAICAALFLAAASPDPWRTAADWWLAWFALASVINLIVLRTLLRREDIGLRDFYRGRARGAHREIGSDLRWVGMALVIAAPLGILPNLLLSSVLWGDTTAGGALSFRPLPVFGAVAILAVFPIVHALAECRRTSDT